MATICICVRESQPNADGTYTIKVAIGAKSRTTYIADSLWSEINDLIHKIPINKINRQSDVDTIKAMFLQQMDIPLYFPKK